MLGGDLDRAESILTAACDSLRAVGEREWLATNSALLAEVLYRQGRFQEALQQSGEALGFAPPGHLTSLAVARRVRAKALAQAGELAEAISLASETITLLRETQVLDEQGEAYAALAEVQALAGFADRRGGGLGSSPRVLRAEREPCLGGTSPLDEPVAEIVGSPVGLPAPRSTSRRANIRRPRRRALRGALESRRQERRRRQRCCERHDRREPVPPLVASTACFSPPLDCCGGASEGRQTFGSGAAKAALTLRR